MLRRVFTLALAAMAVVGCSGDGSGPEAGTARVTLRLTDAPGDIQEAVVTIEEIYLQGGEGGRVVLLDEPVTTDLLTLADSYQTLLTDVEVPAGTYSQLRFVISGAYLRVERAGGSDVFASSTSYEGLPEGATVTGVLQMPSFGASGLKVTFPGSLTLAEGETTLLVDFDVAQSFGKEAGQSGKWVMHPVITGEIVEEPPAAP